MKILSIYFIIFWFAGIYNPFSDNSNASRQNEIMQHLSFLASDELKGRGIGMPELDTAAHYIADYFEKVGLKPAPSSNSYFQEFELEIKEAPVAIDLAIDDRKYSMNEKIIMLNGGKIEVEDTKIEWLDFGTEDELADKSLNGKIVITRLGFPENDAMESYFPLINKKRALIQASGALALIEIYKSSQVPWERIVGYFGRGGGLSIHSQEKPFSHFLINDSTLIEINFETATLSVDIKEPEIIPAKNVLAFVEGTDQNLQDEVILLSAHYDHVGIGKAVNDESGVPDSIYNGARDNASGVVALMMAAKELSKNPGKRPVAFIAYTAEESGLLGSRYYAANPVIPFKSTAFNFNNDNGGYSDTTIVTLVGAGRSNTRDVIDKAIQSSGMQMYQAADLDQTFFRASDNISLSTQGIPSATYSLGFRGMDEEIKKHYHQPSDEVETLNMNYITRWIQGYVEAAKNIANMDTRPFWNEGDEFESAGKSLYELE